MADFLLLLGIGLVLWSLRLLYRQRQVSGSADVHQLKAEIDQAKVDVDELIKELTGVSDQVVEKLSEQIKAAQETLVELEQKSVTPQVADSVVSAKTPEPSQDFEEDRVIRLVKSNDVEKPMLQAPRRQKGANVFKGEINSTPAPLIPSANPSAKHQAVYSLADMGYSTEEIAKRLSIGKGEVALILQLKYKGEEVNGL